ncbi:potassium channel family protein [uncultured Methanobrevibacter sp.]|uniref:potassium channel family protein n=2 Tax=Methanobrevibacter TaxID=2172 RepID=UPI0025DCB747|nr:ion channel [uncultured Methanobrevibacter sp.]
MKDRGMKVSSKTLFVLLHLLVFADIIFITAGLLLDLPDDLSYVVILFDFVVCIFLLSEWIIKFYRAPSKKEFLKDKENIVTFIASIPIEALLPAVIPGANILRYIMFFKLLRIMILYNKFFNGFKKFIKKTNLDKIIGGIFFTVIIFTILYIMFGSSDDLFDSFYFVIVTLTTVGYGDIVPQTFNDRVITILLIIVGIFIVSTITAALSSYLTDRLMGNNENEMADDIRSIVEDNSREVMDELKAVREENKKLHEEINELKELIDNKN